MYKLSLRTELVPNSRTACNYNYKKNKQSKFLGYVMRNGSQTPWQSLENSQENEKERKPERKITRFRKPTTTQNGETWSSLWHVTNKFTPKCMRMILYMYMYTCMRSIQGSQYTDNRFHFSPLQFSVLEVARSC